MFNAFDFERCVLALGWALLHFVWQGLLVGGIAALALWLLRRSSPRWRYAVCALALLACLLLPLWHWVWLLSAESAAGFALQSWPAYLQDLPDQLPAFVRAWSLGVGLMALRLGLGLLWVGRARRQSLPAPALWQARVDALAVRLGLQRPVRLKLWAAVPSPVTVGSWRPLILMPAALLSGLPVPLLEALIAHELAHVRRWDYLANIVQSVVEALLFFHPVVWWLSTRLRAEREQVADELAAQALGDPHCVAQALHALSEWTAAASSPAMSSPHSSPTLMLSALGGNLFTRIQRLLAPQPQTPSWQLALPAVLLASLSLMVQARPHDSQVAAAPLTSPAAPTATEGANASSLLKLPVNAKHALVLEEGSGRVVMQKDPDAQVPIASLTKLLTAMVLIDGKLDPKEKLRIAPEDVDTLKHSASRLKVGTEMTRRSALEMALLISENRAAAALARTYPGGTSAFMTAMQRKIRELGLSRTTIAEPTGLSPLNLSTAHEVAKIVQAAARYPDIVDITSDKTAKVPVGKGTRELRNTNALVGSKGWDIRLSKTGYTEEAGRCLTMRMKSASKHFVVVLLDADGSSQRLRDAAKIRQSLQQLRG